MLCGHVWGPRPEGRAFLSWGFLQGAFTKVRKSSRDVPGGPVVTTLSFQFGVCVCVCVRSLVGEVRSHMLHSVGKKLEKRKSSRLYSSVSVSLLFLSLIF